MLHTIRPVTRDDLSQIAILEQEDVSYWSLAAQEKELIVKGGVQYAAADSSDQLLGWCCARALAPEAELLRIIVANKTRRQGIGKALLSRLRDELAGMGVDTLFLEVRSKNAPALSLYENFGFVRVGLRKGYYSQPEDNAVIMKLQF